MSWFIFAILTAFFESLKDVCSKRSLQFLDEYIVAAGAMGLGSLLLLPILLWQGIPPLGKDFGLALLVGGSLNVVAFTLYVKAIKVADLSLTVPLTTLTPLFLLVTSPLIVREFPTVTDAIGVFLIVIGSYFLNLRERQNGWLAPLKAMIIHQGSRIMLVVAFIWSITAAFDKVGVLNSSPLCWATALFAYIALGITPMILLRSQRPWKAIRKNLKILSLIGLLNGIGVAFQMIAVSIAPVTQVIAIKRMSSLLSVFLGHFVFGEPGLRERLTGAAIMVLGVFFITL
ncbi:MAG: EamA family transporter, partial [Synechococcales bacterium]|nr:EamA family transporter [Synechococcales bacterium]